MRVGLEDVPFVAPGCPMTGRLMRPGKNVLTTGDVAKICNVAPRTVSKWFDAGHLRGYRIPGSKDRRIPIEHLVRFMRTHGIPLNGLAGDRKSVLVVDSDTEFSDAIHQALTQHGGYEVTAAATALEAGAAAQQLRPQICLVEVTLPDIAPKVVACFFRALETVPPVCLIGMARGMTDAQGQALLQEGFNGYLSKPFDVRSLVHLIEGTTAKVPAEDTTRHTPPAVPSGHRDGAP